MSQPITDNTSNSEDKHLLLLDEQQKVLQGVTAMDKDGKIKTRALNPRSKPDQQQKDPPPFIRVDPNGNFLSNFWKNFYTQLKNAPKYRIILAPASKVEKIASEAEDFFQSGKLGDEIKSMIINKNNNQKEVNMEPNNTANEPTQETKKPEFKESDINWEELNKKYGVTADNLKNIGEYDNLMNGRTTEKFVNIKVKDQAFSGNFDARLFFHRVGDQVKVGAEGILKELSLENRYYRHRFTDEEKRNLKETGNLGHLVNLTFDDGTQKQCAVSIDPETNRIKYVKAGDIKPFETINGKTLNAEQIQALKEGKAVYISDFKDKENKPYDGFIQFNAATFRFGIRYPKDRRNPHEQDLKEGLEFMHHKLSKEQVQQLKAGESVFIKELKSERNNTFEAFLYLNKDTRRLNMSFDNPYSGQAQNSNQGQKQNTETQKANQHSQNRSNNAGRSGRRPKMNS